MTHIADQRGDTRGPEKETNDRVPDQEPNDVASRRSLFFRIQKYGYRKFPSFIPAPERHELLEMYRKHDADDNAKTEPPSDEVIDLRCVWAVEFYTPSQISKLVRGFESLGWNTDDSLGLHHNPTRWVQCTRESPDGGGWLNLGAIQRPSGGIHFDFGRKAPLPSGVEYALAAMYSLTSSITCIVIGFVLEEGQNRRFEQALRQRRQTYLMPLRGRGHRIVDPSAQKATDIMTLRDEMRELAAGWFGAHLPGLFASGSLAGEYPTCEFLTLRNAVPFPPHSARDYTHYQWLSILNISNDFYAWNSKELRGMKFVWPLSDDIHSRFHSVIVAREADFSEDIMRHYGGTNRGPIASYVNQFMQGLLSRWALAALLSGFESYLNNMRDSTDFKPNDKVKPLRLLENLAHHITQSVDISAVSAELQNFAAPKGRWFTHNVNVFYPCNPDLWRNEEIVLTEVIRQQIAGRAGWLRNVDRSVRDILIQYGTVLGARENIKLQKRMAYLTWVILALTIVIVILTGVTTVMSIQAGTLSWPW